MKTDWEIRRDIVSTAKKVYDKGFAVATDGNISMRMMSDRIMITPSGSCLGNLNVNDLVYTDITGVILQGNIRPSSELPMHIEIYKNRPEIEAIIHAHPSYSTAFTVAGESFSEPVLPEVILGLGEIPIAPYATPSTNESALAIHDLILNHDAIMLDHHGAVTIGFSLEDAYFKMEKLEHAAATLLAAKQLGTVNPLKSTDVEKLEKIKKEYRF